MHARWCFFLPLLAGWLSLPAIGETVGWRTDGTGEYPQAKLPEKWGKGAKSKWTYPTDQWSNALPVVVGDTVFITEEPLKLIALDRKTGKKLWEESHGYGEVLDNDQLKFFEKNEAESKVLRSERQSLLKKSRGLRRKIRRAGSEAEKQKFETERKELNKKVEAIQQKLSSLPDLQIPSTHKVNGHASYTPVSDGETLVAAFGNGVVAAYDVAGKRKWARWVQNPDHVFGGSISPLISDGKVIVKFADHVALDLKTGQEVWKIPGVQSFGSPVVVEVEGKPVYVSARGEVIDVTAGKMLADNIFNMKDHHLRLSAPVVQDGVLYAVDGFDGQDGRAVAVPLPAKLSGPWKAKWESSAVQRRYYASPIIHDGLLYALNEDGNISVYSAENGELLNETMAPQLERRTYPSLVLAGDELLASDEHGNAVVYGLGKELQPKQQIKTPVYRSTPVFVDDTMYVRSLDGLDAY